MKVRFWRNCHIDKETAELYEQYCKENDFEFEASEDDSLVYFSVYETKDNLDAMNKWILKTLLGGSQRG